MRTFLLELIEQNKWSIVFFWLLENHSFPQGLAPINHQAASRYGRYTCIDMIWLMHDGWPPVLVVLVFFFFDWDRLRSIHQLCCLGNPNNILGLGLGQKDGVPIDPQNKLWFSMKPSRFKILNWLVVWLPSIWNFPIHIGNVKKSQLTNSYFSGRGFSPGPPSSQKLMV